jgi:hypothetical protein
MFNKIEEPDRLEDEIPIGTSMKKMQLLAEELY